MFKSEKYLCYRLGDELFASPLSKVVEIYQLEDLEPIKKGNTVFLGNINLGALEIPLVDLTRIVGRKPKSHFSKDETSIIVFDLSDGPWGALVESIEGIINFSPKEIQRVAGSDSPIYGKASGVKQTYLLLNPEYMVNKMERMRWGSDKRYDQAS
ncbi:MAG: chemotaxis protein CheW [Bdellovibrionaceae bacterium]|nr:chemotaxis protein CheW [Pseudobdellovibrionaceae bacterium]